MANTTNTETTNTEMAEKLVAAGQKAESERAATRAKVVKGSHLLSALLEAAQARGLKVEEKTGFHKITGTTKGRQVYVARKGGRVDLSGFAVVHPAVNQISEEQAREKHLGKVRGQLNFDLEDSVVLDAFGQALEQLNVAPEPQPKTVTDVAKEQAQDKVEAESITAES